MTPYDESRADAARALAHWSLLAEWNGTPPEGFKAAPFSGSVAMLAHHSFFVASPWGALYRSDDSGRTWAEITDDKFKGGVRAILAVPPINALVAASQHLVDDRFQGGRRRFRLARRGRELDIAFQISTRHRVLDGLRRRHRAYSGRDA